MKFKGSEEVKIEDTYMHRLCVCIQGKAAVRSVLLRYERRCQTEPGISVPLALSGCFQT